MRERESEIGQLSKRMNERERARWNDFQRERMRERERARERAR